MTYLAERPSAVVAQRQVSLVRQLRLVMLAAAGLDVTVLAAAGLLAHTFTGLVEPYLPDGPVADIRDIVVTPWIALLWLGTLCFRGAYRRRVLGAGYEEFQLVVSSSCVAAGLLGAVAFLGDQHMDRAFVVLYFGCGVLGLLAGRYAVRKVVHGARRRGHLLTRVVAVCEPGALDELMTQLGRTPQLGFQVVGTCVPGLGREAADVSLPVPLFGGVESIVEACELTDAHTVLVGGGGTSTSRALRQIGWELEGRNVDLVVVPSLIDVAGPRVHMRHLAGLPLVHIEEPGVRRAGGLAKRAFDIVVASLMLLLLSPLMIAIALAVKLGDRGPVFFRQERMGRNGTTFKMTKFRSMVVDADEKLAELSDFNDVDDVLFKMRNDPRVTKVGGPIRKWSLDELPQLFDVLRGDMSLVGPRPPLAREVELYPPEMHRRMLVRPGLTGLWQISGRSDLPFEEAVRMDLYYVDNWSIVSDVIIMLKTARAVVMSRGAY
ncbi:sugar transferase [Nocardioides jiangxiensis]|uniref:Sugar transferase n=1 Tax=Nocardioides jiangxiensis TaxID=3064524 RepID=A0ABT9AZ28_9ACTN|nr:sugar transferase [Nocardioides sp. WY-20]MDO7867844.1 sugar transferase [Nocardioides sp. WY-20]